MSFCVHPVNDGHDLWRVEENRSSCFEKPLGSAQFGRKGCETGFRRGFSQLTFAIEGAQYDGQVSQPSYSHFTSRFRLGTKETCEERL